MSASRHENANLNLEPLQKNWMERAALISLPTMGLAASLGQAGIAHVLTRYSDALGSSQSLRS
jgi:hypothetical protein